MSAAIHLSPAEAARLRQRIEDAVERLIALMDILDPDPDLEEECEDEGGECNDEGVSEFEPDLAGAASLVWVVDGEENDVPVSGPDPWRQ